MSTDELKQIRMVFQGLQTLYQTHLPKVDPAVIHDLLVRELNKKSGDRLVTTVLPSRNKNKGNRSRDDEEYDI